MLAAYWLLPFASILRDACVDGMDSHINCRLQTPPDLDIRADELKFTELAALRALSKALNLRNH
jgi:hypothetical protein